MYIPLVLSVFVNGGIEKDLPYVELEQQSLLKTFSSIHDKYSYINIPNVTIDNFYEILIKRKDKIILFHFGGHADTKSLFFKNARGFGAGIAHFFKKHNLRLVFLNGCNTYGQAKDFLDIGVSAVIVTICPVTDNWAYEFAHFFYDALANDHTFKESFTYAESVLKTKYSSYSDKSGEIIFYRDTPDSFGEKKHSDAPWRLYVYDQSVINWKLIEERSFSKPIQNERLVNYIVRGVQKISNSSKFFENVDSRNKTLVEIADEADRIVLLDEAGMGKTTELYTLNNALVEKGETVIFIVLKENILSIPEPIQTDKPFFVFDGLDELIMEQGINLINKLLREFPNAHFIVSCRSNVYLDALPNFEKYKLAPFNSKLFIEQHFAPKEAEAFFNEFATDEYYSLFTSPFFLKYLIRFYKDGGANQNWTKTELLFQLLKESLNSRLRRIDRTEEDLQIDCIRALERLAFSMECLGKNEISEEEFEKIVGVTQRGILIKQSSLLEFRSDRITFSHRIFQEYLAARVLSRTKSFDTLKSIIGVEPNYDLISPLWTNTLAYLSKLIQGDSKAYSSFMDWLMVNNAQIVVNLDPGTFSEDIRRQFLLKQLDDYNENYRAFLYPFDVKLAEFIQNIEGVSCLLVDRFHPDNSLSDRLNSCFLISKLEADKFIPCREKLILYLSQNIENHLDDEHYILSECLRVILFHFEADKIDVKLIDTLMARIARFNDSSVRNLILNIITKFKLQDQYIGSIMNLLEKMTQSSFRSGTLSNEDDAIFDCLKGLQQEESMIKFFEKLGSFDEDSHELNEFELPAKIMLKKVYKAAITTRKKIVELCAPQILYMIDVFFRTPELIQERFTPEMKNALLNYCLTHEKYNNWYNLGKLVDQDSIKDLINNWKDEEKLEQEWVALFTEASYYAPESKEVLKKEITELRKEAFLTALKTTEEKAWQQDAVVRDLPEEFKYKVDPYLDFETFTKTVTEIFQESGEPSLSESFFHDRGKSELVRAIYKKFPKSCVYEIQRHTTPITLNEFLQSSKDIWPKLSHNHIFELLYTSRFKHTYPELRSWAKTWCDEFSESFKPSRAKFSHDELHFVYYVLFFKLDHFEESIYHEMLGKNFEHLLHFEEDEVTILSFIQKYELITLNRLKEIVYKNLNDNVLKGKELYQNLDFITKHKMKYMRPLLKTYLNHPHENWESIYITYVDLLGVDGYCLELLQKGVDDEYNERRILQDLLFSSLAKELEAWLEAILPGVKDEKKLVMYINALILRGNEPGFQRLIEYLKKEGKMPEFRIRLDEKDRYEHPEMIPLLLEIYSLAYHSNMKTGHEVRYFVSSLLDRMLSRSTYYQLKAAIQEKITMLREAGKINDELGSLSMLLENLGNKYSNQQVKTIEEAQLFYEEIERMQMG